MSRAPSSAVAAIMSAAFGASSFFEQAARVSVALHITTSKDRFAVAENMASPLFVCTGATVPGRFVAILGRSLHAGTPSSGIIPDVWKPASANLRQLTCGRLTTGRSFRQRWARAVWGDTKLLNKVASIWEGVMTFRAVGALRVAILSACLIVPTICASKAKEAEPVAAVAPLRVLVLPVDFDVLEMSAAGMVEPVPAETVQAEEALSGATLRVLRHTNKFQIIDMPAMSDAEKEVLKEHLALYKLTAYNAAQMIRLG